jgi:2-amino-4-hydroxy-6-hydroxymethyldihydropteridine diphosphokinase
MMRAYLGLGSNIKPRREYLERAIELLGATEGIWVRRVSGFLRTEPWGVREQSWFLNAAVAVDTWLDALSLLERVLGIERQLGRVRQRRWGPRTIDIDVLLYGDWIINLPQLKVPHPYLAHREFVLRPLVEIAPGVVDPVSGKTVGELLAELEEVPS